MKKWKPGKTGTILKAGAAVGLAGICATGIASGVACPVLMGTAGVLAFSALRRPGGNDADAGCAACALPAAQSPAKEGPR